MNSVPANQTVGSELLYTGAVALDSLSFHTPTASASAPAKNYFCDVHDGMHALVESLATACSVSTDLPSHLDGRTRALARLSSARRRVEMPARTDFRRAIGRIRKHRPCDGCWQLPQVNAGMPLPAGCSLTATSASSRYSSFRI